VTPGQLLRRSVLAASGWLAAAVAPAAAQDLAAARAAVAVGEYDAAIRQLRGSEEALQVRLLVRTLAEVGRYDEAVAAARQYEERHPGSVAVANVLGEVLAVTGDAAAATEAFQRAAAAGGADDSLDARYNLARGHFEAGRTNRAREELEAFIDTYNRAEQLSSEELAAVAGAVRLLAAWDWRHSRDALRAYDEAIAADPDNLEARVLVGDLFLEKYEGTEAIEAYEAVLERNPRHPGALLGLARQRRFAGSPAAMDFVDRALETNLRSVDALVLRAMLWVELEDLEQAQADVERALAVNPRALDALTLAAGIAFLEGDTEGFARSRQAVFAVNPRYASFYTTLAELSVRRRLYREAVDFAERAVALDSLSWSGHQLLGINRLRIGSMDEGRASLERAFEGNRYDAWAMNTLDLLDTLETYRIERSPRFVFAIDGKEAELLAPYVSTVAEEAYDRMAARYGYRPEPPVRVEIFPDHQDFSVRTVGLAGLGALGVSFGPVVAMDSPSARDAGEFHWAATLWHEIAHTFHLGLSAHRVPRWFTEGLAVFEERRARPGWGDRISPGFLRAFRDGRLHPVSRLNNGFLRPAFPEQLIFSYYQASLVCDLIAQEHGTEALTAILRAFRDGFTNEQVFLEILGTDVADFDELFDDYVRARFAGPLTALGSAGPVSAGGGHVTSDLGRLARDRPDDFAVQLAFGRSLLADGRLDEALVPLQRAKALFPQYGGHSSPYELLARAHLERGALEDAAVELRALTALNAGHYQGLLDLADVEERLGNPAEALTALDRAMYVYPLELDPHRRLAELAEAEGRWDLAVRERRAVLALRPVDRADALYRLARALRGAGQPDAARRTVLQALEIAPGFGAAQDLLLELHDARNP
jgi:tetratricopeptide (TPR) repeat protein